VIFGPDTVDQVEAIVHHIQDNLKASKSRQESYANKRHRPLEFKVGNHVSTSHRQIFRMRIEKSAVMQDQSHR
jgi:hypothetical protein